MLDLPLYLVANERPLINIDATYLINIGLWLFLFVVLRSLLWDPMLKLISAREGGMKGARDTAHTLDADAKLKKAEYEAAMKQARARAASERDKLRNDAKLKENEILAQARESAHKALESQRATLNEQRTKLQAEVKIMVPQLATDIASKVLGREVRA